MGIPVFQLWIPENGTKTSQGQTISILNYNTEFQHNDNTAAFEQYVQKHNPSIIVLTEANHKWLDAIKNTTNLYPYQKTEIKGPGLALFSKYPIEQSKVRYFGKSHHPRIFASLRMGSQPVNLILVHPTTPQTASSWKERNDELSLLHDEVEALPDPKILIGDLNCSPWSPSFAQLISPGMHDSEQSFGPQPSWPAHQHRVSNGLYVPLFVPIDHILVSKDCKVLTRQVGPELGSDHLPVFVKLKLHE
ncbi:MAG: endonuclease/exonuclease/phosphatase family protein [Candidatus Obscuribacterales bacterium]|nr:endonuclease/exonuclease/phosphatase family protein [Candidatus Obscuribacterales bacterium]